MDKREIDRLDAMMYYEKNARKMGYNLVSGIDEVGRGPLAGPVVAACVILPESTYIEGINDSKKLTPKKREHLFGIIKEKAYDIAIGEVYPEEIDRINILNATKKAMIKAIYNLKNPPDYILVDALKLDVSIPLKPIIKGDQKSISIAAASIIAKVYRDRLMIKYDEIYPQYDFIHNKGYGTSKHIDAIRKYGITPIHRKSFTYKFIEKMHNCE